jgi:hypothetical protein
MEIKTVHHILDEAARLIELTASFQAQYGRMYKLNANTPQDARQLYHDIMQSQAIIASYLDNDALNEVQSPYGRWWDHSDVMEPIMAQQILSNSAQLLSSVVHAQTLTPTSISYVVHAIQRAIAGTLHPDSYQAAIAQVS